MRQSRTIGQPGRRRPSCPVRHAADCPGRSGVPVGLPPPRP